MEMARTRITIKNGYRDNVAHALSLGRVDQGGLLDLMLLLLAGWSASAPWDSLLALVGSVVGSSALCLFWPLVIKGQVARADVHPWWGGGRGSALPISSLARGSLSTGKVIQSDTPSGWSYGFPANILISLQ